MKALFWTDGFWPRTGGIETQGLEFIKGMHQRGHEYRVFAQQDFPHYKEREVYEGISIRRFNFTLVQQSLSYLRVIQNELQETIDEFQPDFIHLNASSGLAALVFLLIKTMFQIPVILTLHAPFFYNKKNPFLAQIIDSAHLVCCVSQWVLDQTKALLPEAKNKLKLIYNGLSPQNTSATPLSFHPPVILLLGRLSEEKGFDTAIQAFALLKKRHFEGKLIVAGGGPEALFLKKLVMELALEQCVEFTGELEREAGLYWINQATLVVVPSYFESFGLVALEAMHLRRPVIASKIGGIQEVVLDHETGFLVPPHDPIALSEAIYTLLSDPNKATELGLNGYKRAMSCFTLEENMKMYEDLLCVQK